MKFGNVGRGRWVMHDGMPYGRIQGQGQGHSREVDRQSPTGLILVAIIPSRWTSCHIPRTCLPQVHLAVYQPYFWRRKAPGYLERVVKSSDTSTLFQLTNYDRNCFLVIARLMKLFL